MYTADTVTGAMLMKRKALSNRQLQALWFGVFLAVGLYIWIAETLTRTSAANMSMWHWVIAVLGAWSALGGYSVRHKLMALAKAEASGGREDVAARKWSAAQLLGLMVAQSVVLWGVAAKFIVGGPRWFRLPFYLLGVALLILWKPKKAPIPTAS
jgi:hypothetical protein